MLQRYCELSNVLFSKINTLVCLVLRHKADCLQFSKLQLNFLTLYSVENEQSTLRLPVTFLNKQFTEACAGKKKVSTN